MGKNHPLVSIVIPCYNHENFVKDSIQSVIDQTYQNIELIIIDDGSKDNSVAKIMEMISVCEARFTRFEFITRPNKGLCATLNEALKWCQGEYFASLASDDMILPYKTEIQVDYLNHHVDCVGVFGGIQIIDKNSNKGKLFIKNKYKYKFKDIFLHCFFLPASTQMIRLNIIRSIKYDYNIKIEDWYMWLRLTEHGSSLDCLPNLLAYYRRHDDNFSNKIDIMQIERLNIIEKFKEHPLYKTAKQNAELVYIYENFYIDKIKSINIFFKNFINYILHINSVFFFLWYKVYMKIINM